MAVVHRILNSTVPFSMSSNQPKVEALGYMEARPQPCCSSTTNAAEAEKMSTLSTFLLKIISHGTAKHMGPGPLGTEKPSIIAQAECESQDSQEFCPNSSSTFCYVQGASSQHRPHRRRRRRHRRRQGERRESSEATRVEGEERVERLTGVQEQDSGEVGECHYSSPSSEVCSSDGVVSTESLCVQETAHALFPSPYIVRETALACDPDWSRLVALAPGDPYEEERHSPLPSQTSCSLAVSCLRNYVTHTDPTLATPFINQLDREVKDRQEKEEEASGCEEEWDTNEGLLFRKELHPDNHEYREGREYDVREVLKLGSYGEVYSITDKCSGFTCAAKKVPLQSFSREEVGTWSVLQNPRVVELFGFVREGPSIILFMDLKPGSLGQLLKERGRLPEDLSLHYMQQVLGALEYLHRKCVLHLDIKADNVLLSEDGLDTFLCDFGQSERLDQHGFSPFRGLKGTETHMAPEVARSETRCAKADVWSSCCMLLHMLSGWQPWIRFFSRPLYLKIAEEPPPLKETPSGCSPHTAEVIKQGLLKDPSKRASAKQLRAQTAKALQQLGGLHSSARGGAYQKPIEKPDRNEQATFSHSSVQQWMGPEHQRREGAEQSSKCESTDDMEEVEDEKGEEEDDEEDVERSEGNPPPTTQPTEQEFRKLEMDLYVSSLSHLHSAERQEQLLSYLGSDCLSPRESWDKKDSGRWSVGPSDDLSSGVFSYSSQSDGLSISMDWPGPAPQPRCFEGVDVCIRDFDGRSLHIRETPRVKVGHIAVGISDQISEKVFSLCCEDGSLVHHNEEVQESGLILYCVPAPDHRHAHPPEYKPCCDRVPDCRHAPRCKAPWTWRVRDGELETWD
ncbi:mitogen-activated protein kinase kinase kinase 14 [Brachyhypopomus gauderio]|uniref:mitogen-activated protein kinase kinase kinase 14 n=1 Tax=Brachyhypopomus gauderio TaxID=698409 RepID=UPI00404235C3